MTVVQAAAPSQTEPDPAVEEPLPQPMRIRINQLIPLTLTLPAALVDDSGAVTRPLTATGSLTAETGIDQEAEESEPLTATTPLSSAAAVTSAGALTESDADVTTTTNALAGALGDALSDAIAGATDVLTETDALTSTVVITDRDVLTATPAFVTVPVTLELALDLVVTNTLTSTVPASVTLQLADRTTRTLPISLSVAALPEGEIFIELLPPAEEEIDATPTITATEEATITADITEDVTPTEAITPALEVTPTVAAPSGLPVVTTTATTTANLRAGPSTTTFDIVGQAAPGQTLSVVGISEDGQWYLLDGGAWIATFLAADAAIPNLPLATQELIDQASGNAPVTPITPISDVAEAVTQTVEATPVPATTPAVSPTTTTDANLRAGPGTEFPVIGGTVTGQTINIVGRNADATWWRLDNTGWIFGELVLNPPAAETVPVVNADGTLIEPATVPAAPTATPEPTGGGLALPTPTPAAGAATGAAVTTTTTAEASASDANYISAVQGIVTTYDGIVQTLDSLIAEARADSAVLTDPAWANRVSASLILLRRTGASVGELVAPAAISAAQDSLIDAATQYTAAGNALSQAASTAAVAQLDAAETAIQAANASLAAVETALSGAQ